MEKYETKESLLLRILISDLEEEIFTAQQRYNKLTKINDRRNATLEAENINDLRRKMNTLVDMKTDVDNENSVNYPVIITCGYSNREGLIKQLTSYQSHPIVANKVVI